MDINKQRRLYQTEVCNWLRANGIDPECVPVDSPLDVNASETELRYVEVVKDSHRQLVLDKHWQPMRVDRTVRLAVPPPTELRAALAELWPA